MPILEAIANGSVDGYLSSSPIGNTAFDSIATATGTGSSGTITFSSIPATYRYLQIKTICRSSSTFGSGELSLRFNGDTAANYHHGNIISDNAGRSSAATTGATSILIQKAKSGTDLAANIFAVSTIDVFNYANTSMTKTIRSYAGIETNSTQFGVAMTTGLWFSTSAINSISIINSSGNFATTDTFALYGIKAS